jgi:hypothetical protein
MLVMLLFSSVTQRHLYLKAEPPNARIDPPENICAAIQVLDERLAESGRVE